MRILHTSDWHLGKMLENVSRLEEQREFIDCLCETVEKENIDLVLVAGDIYDTYNPSAAAEELFYSAMDRLNDKGKRAIVVIAGNHDNPERLCAASPLAYKNGIVLLGYPGSDAGTYKVSSESIKIVDSGPGWLELSIVSHVMMNHEMINHDIINYDTTNENGEHVVLLTLPYPSESRLEEVISEDAEEGKLQKAYSEKIGSLLSMLAQKFRDDTINIVMGHLFLKGGKESESERTLQVGGALTVNPEVLPPNAHFVALGHLHRPQKVKNAPCPAYYSGSPLAYSFSEADYSKLVYLIDAQPGLAQAEIKECYLDCGRLLRKWKATDGIEQAIEWCTEGKDQNAWIDLEIYTDRILTMEEQKKLRELHPGIINIRPVLKTDSVEVSDMEHRENKKIDELFKDYYKSRNGTEISEELMSVFLDVLNHQEDEETSETGCGGEDIETKVS